MIGDLSEAQPRRRPGDAAAASTTSSTSPRSTTWARTRPATRCSTSAARSTRSTSPTRSRSARFHHMSSIAVAGLYDEGTFNEDMFDEGQKLAHPYHRTKFESEKLVRERVKAPWRVYRPSLVIGDSRTGEMDKIDGPYYFFKLIQKVRHDAAGVVPADLARVGLDEHRPGRLRRRGRRPHRPQAGPRRPGLPRRRPQGPARRRGPEHVRGGRPRAQGRDADRQARDRRTCPRASLSFALKLPALKQIRANVLADLGIPDEVVDYIALTLPLRRARHAARAARHRASSCRRCASYATKIWDYWERHARPGPLQGPLLRGRGQRQDGRDHGRVERHRPRGGAEDRGRGRDPDPRRAHQGEARRGQGRDRGRGRHRLRRALRPQRLRRDRAARRDAAGRPRARRHARQQRGTLDPALA